MAVILKSLSEFGLYVKKVRRQKRISQSQLAEKIGCSLEWVNKIENAKEKPSISMMKKICGALEVSPLFDLAETKTPEK